MKDIDAALAIEPNHPTAIMARGFVRYQEGKNAEAKQDLTKVIDSQDGPTVRFMLGSIARDDGDYPAAVELLKEALRMNSEYVDALNCYAWILATCPTDSLRDGETAVRHATKACELTKSKNFTAVGCLAAAYALQGQFDEAVRLQTDAIDLVEAEEDKESLREMLGLYRSHKPFREEADPHED